MSGTVEQLLALLDLEEIETNHFRGQSAERYSQQVFGGQVLGQALVAAQRTVDGRAAHSLHAYFLRPGSHSRPILYEVDRIRDGKSFATRRVVAIQAGQAIFNMSISFHAREDGFDHQVEMPEAPGPEGLPTEHERRASSFDRLPEVARDWITRERAIEIRPVDPVDLIEPDRRPPFQRVWFRARGRLPDDVALHQCVLAYASDMTLLDTALLPHGVSWVDERLQSASIDHTMWFHRPFRADEWLFYHQESPSAAGARGFNRGSVFSRDGRLVASVAQEGLMRVKRAP